MNQMHKHWTTEEKDQFADDDEHDWESEDEDESDSDPLAKRTKRAAKKLVKSTVGEVTIGASALREGVEETKQATEASVAKAASMIRG